MSRQPMPFGPSAHGEPSVPAPLSLTSSDGGDPASSSEGRRSAACPSEAPSLGGSADGPPPPQGEDRVGCRSVRPSRRTSRTAFFEEPPAADDPLLGFAPYLHAAPRRNSITPERQRAFIAALAASGIVTQAARAIGVSLEALYTLRHRKGAEGFSDAWDKAVDRGMMRLEDCALERAIRGEERPVASQGKVVATYTRHDTALMLFLLRQRRASRYGTEDQREVLPGSPLYERIRREVLNEDEQSLEEVRVALRKKLEGFARQVKLRREMEAEAARAAAEREG